MSHWIRPGGSWHPEYLTPLHLPLILEKRVDEESAPLYARKVSGTALLPMQARSHVADTRSVQSLTWLAAAAGQVDEAKGSRRLLDVLDRVRECPNAIDRGTEWTGL